MIQDAATAAARIRRITGLEPTIRETLSDGWVITALEPRDNRSIVVRDGDLTFAVRRFLEDNLRQIRAMKWREQKGRCARCGRRSELLELHHIVHRSRERDDRPDNLELIDDKCHGEAHGPALPFREWLDA